ncbi:MAG: 3-oxoacyl-[acyl-carrier-protein] synthase II [Kiritimatiellia bacterium]
MTRRVVITGLGTVNPCGNDVPDTWRSVLEGQSGIGPVTRFDVSGQRYTLAGEVRNFDDVALLGRKFVRRTGLFMRYAVVAADQAMLDAGYSAEGQWPASERLGVSIGSGVGGLPEIIEGGNSIREEGPRRFSPFFIPRSLGNVAAGLVAIRNKAEGPSMCMGTACAAGNHSIGEGWRAIRYGDADVMICGGTEAALTPVGYFGFASMKALSKGTDSTASRPFDASRDGFVMSEGAGIIVMEELEHARARGTRIYAEVIGFGLTTDAHHVTAPHPTGRGAVRSMEIALRSAGVEPADVDYINAHGTSTAFNDVIETKAIHEVFGEHARRLAVSSTKGVTGHLLGGSGGLEAVICAKVLQTGWVPPTAHLNTPDSACDLDYISEGKRHMRPDVVMSNGFGFGGTNAVLLFRRYEE